MADRLFLLDSNICIYHLAGGNSALMQRMDRHRERLVTSAICHGEVMLGIARGAGGTLAGARALFAVVEVRPFDRAAAERYAMLPFRRGRFDRLIAAHALALGAVLVTNNPGDFADVPELACENWAA